MYEGIRCYSEKKWLEAVWLEAEALNCDPTHGVSVHAIRPLRLMPSKQTVAMCVALALVGTCLQGCGCDEETAKKCLEDKTKELQGMIASSPDAAKVCDAVKGMFACITDADGCCDNEDLKANLDQSKKSFESFLKDCDIKSC